MTFRGYDVVQLTQPLAQHGLPVGAQGTVVMAYDNPRGYTVEFGDGGPGMLALVDFREGELESIAVLHWRQPEP